ncbi:hypothetical protein [Legionella fallonii]|uniref:Uncharacterized protein n=1 Tax=Legionella fallonii LLAP-10 TaxID=1212491 RepID=A0A098G2Z4_9GAMM|nr:hypothetical protein [Legionella fallonii]CEG56852.1 protein of unknown function [Legionella fallonii LLAP-10]
MFFEIKKDKSTVRSNNSSQNKPGTAKYKTLEKLVMEEGTDHGFNMSDLSLPSSPDLCFAICRNSTFRYNGNEQISRSNPNYLDFVNKPQNLPKECQLNIRYFVRKGSSLWTDEICSALEEKDPLIILTTLNQVLRVAGINEQIYAGMEIFDTNFNKTIPTASDLYRQVPPRYKDGITMCLAFQENAKEVLTTIIGSANTNLETLASTLQSVDAEYTKKPTIFNATTQIKNNFNDIDIITPPKHS